jgi:hypothetical protein
MSDEKKVASSLIFVAHKPVLCVCFGFYGDPDPAFCRNTDPDPGRSNFAVSES